ncbi:MAG TPA: FAD-dependent oxidoreductase [Tepidisphaeraceae bacterium]|nr:FAD-dependent oxidoreductase [Tepidisphaeraceae bacterium]
MSRAYRSLIRHGLQRGLPSRAGFSRRDLLRRSAALTVSAATMSSLGWLTGGCASSGKDDAPQGEGLRVVVIGAGFAGLACADQLHRNGADVTVLEAADRPGGRVFTDRQFIPGKHVELGGEFIGENHPTWIALARQYKIELEEVPEYEGDTALIFGGQVVPAEKADALYEEVDAALAELIERSKSIDPVRPWTSSNANELDNTTFRDAIEKMPISQDAKRLMLIEEESDQGVPPEKMSLLCYLALVNGHGGKLYYEITETHRLAGGNDALASAIANALREQVRYKSVAVAIERRENSATVKTNDGKSYDADAVVLAIPPSVWNTVQMTPRLDPALRPQMGSNVKLLTALNKPVWEDAKLHPDLVADGPVNLTWISTDGTGGDDLIGFTFFSGGRYSEKLRSITPPEERTRQAIASVAPAYPNLADHVKKDRFMDWPAHPRAKASYSFPAPGQVTAFGPTLVDGIHDGLAPLRFAGEHTNYGFIGYMEGALSSGVRVAKDLLKQHAVK